MGRWWALDPKADELNLFSPYVSINDNPILFNDSKGDFIPLITGAIGAAGGLIYGLCTGKSNKELVALTLGGFVAGATAGFGSVIVASAGGIAAIGGANTAYLIGGSAIVGGGLGNIVEQVIKNNGKVDGNEVLVNMVFGIPESIIGSLGDGVEDSMIHGLTKEFKSKTSKQVLNNYKKMIAKELINQGLTRRQANKAANKAIKQFVKNSKERFVPTKIFIKVVSNTIKVSVGTILVGKGNATEDFVKQKKEEKKNDKK